MWDTETEVLFVAFNITRHTNTLQTHPICIPELQSGNYTIVVQEILYSGELASTRHTYTTMVMIPLEQGLVIIINTTYIASMHAYAVS